MRLLNNRITIILLLVTTTLIACDQKNSFKDLHEYVSKLEHQIINKKQKISKALQQPETTIYQKSSTRTPFEETANATSELNKGKNPITLYPLNALRFVGTITQNGKVWAYLMTPDKKVFQSTIGDEIGDHNGRIEKINNQEIEIREPLSTNTKTSAQRIVTLELK